MNYIIASSGNLVSHRIDEHFGRAPWLVKFIKEERKTFFYENPYKDLAGGISEKMIEWLKKEEISVVIAAEFGSKMRDKLENEKIRMVVMDDLNLTVQEIIKRLLQQ